jgi:hypothetical protein
MIYNALGVTKYNCHSIKRNNICCEELSILCLNSIQLILEKSTIKEISYI